MSQRRSKTLHGAVSPMGATAAGSTLAPRSPFTPILPSLWVLAALLMASFLSIIIAMTPLTHNLDDIKVALFMTLGPILMLGAAWVLWRREAPLPPKLAALGLLGYGLVLLVSTLASEYHWVGWPQVYFVWSAAGFFMAAYCLGAYRASSRMLLHFLVLQLLLTTLIGFCFFDPTTSPAHHSLVAWYTRFIYGTNQYYDSDWFKLLSTLSNADSQMQSTILSRDFFAGYCVLFLPLALLLALDPGHRHTIFWRLVGLLAAILTVLAIFFCQSKGEWIFGVVSIVFFSVMFLKIGRMPDLKRRHLLAWSSGLVSLLLLVAWLQSPTLFGQLKTVSFSYSSRAIIWSGAWHIFLKHKLLGGGPGTFRIYFPAERSADYFNHEISNVTTFAHNYFLDLLCETGLLGFLCFALFLGTLIILGLRFAWRHSDPRLRLWLAAVLAGMVGIYGSNMSSPNARWVIGATPLWTVMGLLAGLVRQAQGWSIPLEPATPTNRDHIPFSRLLTQRWVPAGIALVGLIILPLAAANGINYWRSALVYANGLDEMEQVYERMKNNTNLGEADIAQLESSVKHFNRAIEIDYTNTSAYYKLGSVYTSLSSLYQEIAQDQTAKGHDPEASNNLKIAAAYLTSAKNTYEKLRDYDPDYAEIHYNMGIIYQSYANFLKRGGGYLETPETDPKVDVAQYEYLALEHLERMGKMSVKAEVYKQQGSQYMAMGQWARARDVFRDASQRYPDDTSLKLTLDYYQAAMQVRDFAGAAEALQRLWLKAPADDQLLDQLISIATEHKLDDTLKQVIDRLEHINPIHPRLQEIRFDLAYRHHQPDQVIKAVTDYIRCGGQDMEVYALGGQAAQNLGQHSQAQEFFKQIVRLDKDGKTTYGLQARRWLNQSRPPSATPAPAPASAQPIVPPGSQSSKAGAPVP